MEQFSELIRQRRSMRKRSNSWQFIAIDDKETLKKLSFCKDKSSDFLAEAA